LVIIFYCLTGALGTPILQAKRLGWKASEQGPSAIKQFAE